MNQQRLTVHDAARRLGISEDAVRMRVKRDTLAAEREDGRLYVLLDNDPTDRTDELIAELRDRVRSLERANEENRRIIAGLTQRIPELLPASGTTGSSEATEADESPGPTRTPTDAGDDQETGAQPRPWWRRMFGR